MNKKTIPNNIKQCVTPDSVTENLWQWAENLKKIGLIAAAIIAIGGIITSFTLAVDEGVLIGILITVLVAVAVYFFFFAISLLINALANILYNTHISANVALVNISQQAIEILENQKTTEDTQTDKWRCEKCGAFISEEPCPVCKELDA